MNTETTYEKFTFGIKEYTLVRHEPSNRQELLDQDGGHVTSFYTYQAVTPDICKFFLAGYCKGFNEGHTSGVKHVRVSLLRTLGLPLGLLDEAGEESNND